MTGARQVRSFRLGRADVVVMVPEELVTRFGFAYHLLTRVVASARGFAKGAESRPPDRSAARDTGLPATPTPEEVDPQAREILDEIAPLSWYHTIDLGHGVTTPGFVDHRSQVGLYELPESLAGMRCLDVATFDGFWAFEMERRGAAEVVAMEPEVHQPDAAGPGGPTAPGDGFRLAHRILGSGVRHETCGIDELSPETVGTFDLVLMLDLLPLLRDPQDALERACSVCRGTMILSDRFDPAIEWFGGLQLARFTTDVSGGPRWVPNTSALRAMMHAAGLEPVEEVSRLVLQTSVAEPIDKVVLRGSRPSGNSSGDRIDPAVGRQNRSAGHSQPLSAVRGGRVG